MKFPKRKIDISEYQSEVKTLLNDNKCAIFIDTNIISQLYRLNDAARQDFYNWVKSCGERFHIPVWVIHEYSDKIYNNKTKDYLSELSKIKQYSNDFSNISDFVKGYIGESLLVGSVYQGKVQDLKNEIDVIEDSLKKISTAISKNIATHQSTVHDEIIKQLEERILNSDIYSIVHNAESIYSQRSNNRIPPGYKDNTKEDNRIGDYIIWKEILLYCRENSINKAILITRDMKPDITYSPDNQTVDGSRPAENSERIKVAKNSLVHEFFTYTKSDQFKIIDFKTFVKISASQYKELALSFQLAIAEEEKENAISKIEAVPSEKVNIEQKSTELHKDENTDDDVISKQDILYSGTAISDGQYDNEANIGCMDEIITQLKSHNWYVQNPAIDKIIKKHNLDCPNTIENRNSIFVLGRNIVQAAEGSSGNAIMFMENINIYIKDWDDVFKQAMIDGMFMEVFFNSEGKIRPNEFKAKFFEDIITNVQKLSMASPYQYINDRILKVKSRFVPLVGEDTEYTFVFFIDSKGKTTKLQCNGKDISNTFKRSWWGQFSDKENIEESLSSYYGILKKNIKVKGLPEEYDVVTYIEEPVELPF